MLNQLAQSWLSLQCQMIPGVRRAILMLGPAANRAAAPAAAWPSDQLDMTSLAESGRLALQKRTAVVLPQSTSNGSHSAGPVILACPLFQQDQLFGVVTLELETLVDQQQQTLLQLLKWSAAWLQLLPQEESNPAIAARLATVIEITAKSLEPPSLQAAATSVITHLAQVFACDRVSFGLLEGREMWVRALSHSAQIDRRLDLVRGIEAAMNESLDELASLAYPSARAENAQALPAHERLCAGRKGGAVCTLLLSDAGKITGALTLERHHGPAFDNTTIDVCEAIVALIAPVFEMKRLNDRSLLAKACDTVSEVLGKILGPGRLWGKLTLAGLLGLAIWLSLATGSYRISAAAALEGTEQRALVAATEGYIKQAYARAGELVKKGEVIATMDDRDLQLERRRWTGELDDLSKRHSRALGHLDRAEATIIEAQLGKVRARLALIEEQLTRTRIIAPFDGVIVSGDLSRSLGAPVERGQILFELAPLNAYRMALQVHESDIGHVETGQRGYIALSAMPDQRMPFVVDNIVGIAQTDEGQNGFRVEARLEGETHKLRPGMRGVGKIEAGERNLLWVWGHLLFDRVSLWLWAHLP